MPLESPNNALGEWVEKQRSLAQQQETIVEPAQETPAAEPEVVETEPPVVEEPPIEATPTEWDTEEVVTQEPVAFDFNKLGSVLDFGEIKNEEEFVAKASALKTKLKQLEEDPLSGIPDEVKEIIKVAKTGDMESTKEYLSTLMVDYSKFDPIIEFENEFYKDAVNNPRFQVDGKFNQELADQTLEAIPEYLRGQHGKDILYRKQQAQFQIRQAHKAMAEQKIAAAEKSLSEAAKNLQELLPFENYGIKFESKHSSQIYEGITNSKLTKKHMGLKYEDLVRSGADMKAVARTVAAAEYAEKMVKFKADNAKSSAAKEILAKTQNAQIITPGSAVQPDSEKKVLTAAEKLAHHLKSVKVGL